MAMAISVLLTPVSSQGDLPIGATGNTTSTEHEQTNVNLPPTTTSVVETYSDVHGHRELWFQLEGGQSQVR